MTPSRQNFFKAHWDWLVALAGLLMLGFAGFYLVQSIKQTSDDAKAAYDSFKSGMPRPREAVEPADLSLAQKAFKELKAPSKLPALDPKKKSFLGSERRVFCQKGDDSSKKEACGRPIPADAEVCPFPDCGMKQHVAKVEVDSDGDGLPNDWEKKYGLNPNDSTDADKDADKDGFTNREEFEAKTDPRDPKDHPDYMDSLSVAGAAQETTLSFWFKDHSPAGNRGTRFSFQMLDKSGNDLKGFNTTLRALKDEQIGKTGFFVGEFTKKSEMREIAGSKGLKKPEDVSTLVLVRKADGKKLTVTRGVRHIPIETEVPLKYTRGQNSWDKTVSEGSELDLNGEKYRVVKLKVSDQGSEVTVENAKTKKQKVIR
jgi:hypothetical protein